MRDEYDEIYGNTGALTEGQCLFCGADIGMKHQGKCFVCTECGKSVHEDAYYSWGQDNDL